MSFGDGPRARSPRRCGTTRRACSHAIASPKGGVGRSPVKTIGVEFGAGPTLSWNSNFGYASLCHRVLLECDMLFLRTTGGGISPGGRGASVCRVGKCNVPGLSYVFKREVQLSALEHRLLGCRGVCTTNHQTYKNFKIPDTIREK